MLPPTAGSFSSVMTDAPFWADDREAAKPPPPAPTMTTSASLSHFAGGATGAIGSAFGSAEALSADAVLSLSAFDVHPARTELPTVITPTAAEPFKKSLLDRGFEAPDFSSSSNELMSFHPLLLLLRQFSRISLRTFGVMTQKLKTAHGSDLHTPRRTPPLNAAYIRAQHGSLSGGSRPLGGGILLRKAKRGRPLTGRILAGRWA